MYARVTSATAQSGKIDEAIKIMRDSILPAAKKQKGFKGLYFLTDRSTGKGIVIVQWNTQADMTTGESSTYYKDQVAKVMPLMTGTPTMEHYEVTVRG